MTEIVRQVAHRFVENTQVINTGDRGRTHLNEPEQELTFDDIIDIFNPLQHLPLVSILYREITGDEIKPAMRILGGIGYGGPTGFMGSVAQVLFEAIFGDDVGGTLIGMVTGEDDEASPRTEQLASTDPAATQGGKIYATFNAERGSHR